jgi:arabinosaccharide transport system substrate-binding protein
MQKFKKASFLAVIFLLIATMFLTGCGGSNGTSQSQGNDKETSGVTTEPSQGNDKETTAVTTVPGKKTTLNFWTFVGLHQQFYEDAAKAWNVANPNNQITLKATTYPYDDMHNKLLLSLQSGVGAPDIVDIEISKFSNFLKGKIALEPLDDIIKPVRDKFVQSRLDIYSKDNHLYGMPTHVGATVMYYNKKILDQAGVNPDDIKTWDDYVQSGKKVVAATGKPMGTVEVTGLFSYFPMVVQQDSDFFDKDGKVTLDNQTNITTLQFLKDMIYKDKILVPAAGGHHHAEEYYGFMGKGGAASVMMPIWYMGRFLEYMPDLKGNIVIRPMPSMTVGGKRSAGMGGTGTAVTNQSKDTSLAKEFLAYAKGSEEGNIKIWKTLGFDPPRWDVWDKPEMKEPNKYTDYFGTDIFQTLLSMKDEINSPMNAEKTPKAVDLVTKNVMFKVLKEQSQTPEQALKAAADELRK